MHFERESGRTSEVFVWKKSEPERIIIFAGHACHRLKKPAPGLSYEVATPGEDSKGDWRRSSAGRLV